MADKLVIKKDGLVAYYWNADKYDEAVKRDKKLKDKDLDEFYDQRKPLDESIWSHLRTACTIEEDVALGDIFRMVESYPLLQEFIKQYSWCWDIEAFHEQAKKPRPSKDKPEIKEPRIFDPNDIVWDDDDLQGVVISHGGSAHTLKDGSVSYDSYEDFYGWAPPAKEGESAKSYGISYSPLNEIAHLPVKLEEGFKITHSTRFKGEETVFYGNRYFTLLEILDAIYWDISFVGGPEEREAFLKEVQDRLDQYEGEHNDA